MDRTKGGPKGIVECQRPFSWSCVPSMNALYYLEKELVSTQLESNPNMHQGSSLEDHCLNALQNKTDFNGLTLKPHGNNASNAQHFKKFISLNPFFFLWNLKIRFSLWIYYCSHRQYLNKLSHGLLRRMIIFSWLALYPFGWIFIRRWNILPCCVSLFGRFS